MDQDQHPQYGIPELRQLMKGGGRTTTTTPSTSSHFPSDFFGFNLAPVQPPPHRLHQFTTDQDMGFLPRGIHGLGGGSSTAGNNSNLNASTSGGGVGFSGFLDGGGFGSGVGGDGGGTGRWPRQETLTLLEIRSRLDHKFKEANQKGPLWDEVSRIMSEEHGYQRSGKKCREKFENLYKYYRKTKEGKAGRQDGKHYRFFRQLEALYGDSNNLVSCPNHNTQFMSSALHGFHTQNPMNVTTTTSNIHNVDSVHGFHQSLSLSNNYNSSELELMTSSSEGNDSSSRRKKRSWKAKIKEFIDTNMKRLIERQDVWLEKLTKVIEDKEEQRMMKEEEWRKIEAARIDKEHLFWAKERARMEARDVAVIEALQYLTGKPLIKPLCSSPEERTNGNNEIRNNSETQNENGSDQTMTNNVCVKGSSSCWGEQEILKLMEIRTSMDSTFQEILGGCSDEFLWEEIAAKLIQLGFDQRSALLCKEKWEWISNGMRKEKKQINKKRKDNSSSCGVYYPRNEENPIYNNRESGYNDNDPHQINEQGNVGSSTSNANANANVTTGNPSGAMAASTNCFPFFMGDGDQNLWESYGLRLSKEENQ
ncbi:GT2-like protein [Arabidopsis thaliana]|uniref:Trihelix transcription factor PTL n=1 Tax=Arabidopsis thaliana TaxID=3702 RepID=PTL_ARATH|nr:Duplicated homeodomain-like superfamily protein [Arabidopsis thaliana]Q9LZS0.1 RecName: Full=Trihelix transcription factor PTL; AltName: Full=Trihelix DNA-binding protein PETAL LOSS [Arabidopsis thaliana]AED90641.1 Duplicated homeodomain-like superfamily protein [Arabidopsis thaliana]CAB82933.1 GT2-like protein [Arabidopsis thaliana]|eukprot:NP_195988.1 Duplicated homeodomain-like superfamily protein [Arabidopsis thaliana]